MARTFVKTKDRDHLKKSPKEGSEGPWMAQGCHQKTPNRLQPKRLKD